MSRRPSTSTPSGRRSLPNRVAGLAAAAGVVLWTACDRPSAGSDPLFELSIATEGMEAPVADKIETAASEVARSPESGFAWGRLGMVLQAHGLSSAAIGAYEEARALSPDDYRWPFLAALALRREDPERARELLELAAASRPPRAAPRVDLGDLHLSLGDLDQAEGWYRSALEIEPRLSHALLGLGRVESGRGNVELAIELLERAAGVSPRHGEVHAELARLHRQRGADDLAGRAERLATAWPATTRSYDPAIEAMEAEGVSSRVQTDRGLALAAGGRFEEAARAFRAAVEVQPQSARAHANLGAALARSGRVEEALAEFGLALEIAPDDPWTLNNLGLTLADAGRLDEAAARIGSALAEDPGYAEAHGNLGLVLARQGRSDEALDSYRRAISLDPSLAEARIGLGTLLAERGRLGEAVAEWQAVLEIEPDRHEARYNLAVAAARLGDHERSIARLEEGLELAPNSSRFARELAWQLATAPDDRLRDGARSVELAQRVVDGYPSDHEAADTLAAAWAERGEMANAVRWAERALALSRARGTTASRAEIEARLHGYRLGRPYRQASSGQEEGGG